MSTDRDKYIKILAKDLRDDIQCKISIRRENDKWNSAPVLNLKISNGSKGTWTEKVSMGNPVDGLITANRIITRLITRELIPDMKFICSFAVRHKLKIEETIQPMDNMGGIDMTTGFPICQDCKNGCDLFKQEHEIGGL